MNERLHELARQAGLKVNADGEIGPAYFGSVDAGYRKFAQVIVEECAQRAEAICYMGPDFSALAEELRRMVGDENEESEEDSACPLCGFDGGTQCGMPNCQY